MLLLKILIFSVIFPLILAQWQYYYKYDYVNTNDKDKIRNLAHELVVEANYKIQQITDIRNRVAGMVGFEVGMIIGQIKEKYRSMLELYRQAENKYSGASKIIMPEAEIRMPLHYLVRMEIIHSLENDIDRLIHLLETIPEYKLKAPQLRG